MNTHATSQPRTRNIAVGHSSITWPKDRADRALQEIGELGFAAFETFPWDIEKLDREGGFEEKLHAAGLPLIAAYCPIDLTNNSGRKEELGKALRWSRLLRRFGARIFVVGPNSLDRATFDFKQHKAGIVSMLNDVAMVVRDEGLTPALHQHTGTCVETRDETYATLDAANTELLKFCPDVGQLTKGGADALQVLKDYLPLVQHMHLKDYRGENPHLLGYAPLGAGVVDVPAILDVMENRPIPGMIMGELDNDWDDLDPTPPIELVRQSKSYLESIGVKFRA